MAGDPGAQTAPEGLDSERVYNNLHVADAVATNRVML